VRVANDSAFLKAPWEKITPTVSWNLPSSVPPGTTVYVYYQFLLADGDMTDTASVAIRYGESELRLDLSRTPQNTLISWTAPEAILEESKSVTGPWTAVP